MYRLAALAVSLFLLAGTTVACGEANSLSDHGRHSETVTTSPGTAMPTGPVIAIEGMIQCTGAGGAGNRDHDRQQGRGRAFGDVQDQGHVRRSRRRQGAGDADGSAGTGEYPFYCLYHPAMLGTLTVKYRLIFSDYMLKINIHIIK